MAKVKLHRVSNMSTYAATMSAYAEQYRSGFQSVATHFTSGVQDEEGLAINAFLNKINALQAQIFETYPAAIEACAQVVDTYAEGIQGAGFPEICWTNDEGISSVGTKLTGTGGDEQMGLVEAKRSELAKAMDAAEEATGVASLSGDLMTTKNQAEANFGDSKQARDSKHQEVSALFDSFISGLDSSHESLSAANALIRQATLVTSISPATILEAITNKTLTADEMYYLDAIQSKDDVELVSVLLNEHDYEDKEQFYKDLGTRYTTGVSQETVTAVYGRLYQEMPSANTEIPENGYALTHIEAFMRAVETHDATVARDYLKKLITAGAQSAGLLRAQGVAVMPDFPKEGATEKEYQDYIDKLSNEDVKTVLQKLSGELKQAGLLADIFKIAYTEGIGKTTHTYSAYYTDFSKGDAETAVSSASYDTEIGIAKGSLKLTKDGISLTLNPTYGKDFEKLDRRTITSTSYTDQSSLRDAAAEDRFKELTAIHKQAIQDLQVETLKSITESSVTLLSPQWGVLVGVANAMVGDDDDLVKSLNAASSISADYLADINYGNDSLNTKMSGAFARGGAGLTIVGNIINYYDRVKEIDKQYEADMEQAKKSAKAERSALFFDYGGTHVNSGRSDVKNYYYYGPEYDLEASLQMDDLEKNGLRGYVFRESVEDNTNPENVREAIKKLQEFDREVNKSDLKGKYTKGVKDLITGNSNQTVSEIGINQVSEGFQEFEKQLSSNLFDSSIYRKENAAYFERLVKGNLFR